MKVRCNQCMNVFDEDKIVYDIETDTEYCPKCNKSGCLMDLHDDDLMEDLAIEQREQM